MSSVVYLTLSVVGILVEATLSPVPLGLVFVILAVASGEKDFKAELFLNSKLSFLLAAFALGLLADIFLLRPIGVTGAIYGGVVVLLRMYSHKFETARLTYLVPFSGLIVGLYSRFFYLEWRRQVIVAMLIVVFARLLSPNQNKIRYGANWHR